LPAVALSITHILASSTVKPALPIEINIFTYTRKSAYLNPVDAGFLALFVLINGQLQVTLHYPMDIVLSNQTKSRKEIY